MSQYVVITHNRKTAVAASSLLGVTMEESGITKVVQLKWNDDLEDHHLVFAEDDDFVEEDVPPEEGIVIPPRPPRREHNPDGSLKLPAAEAAEDAEATDTKVTAAEAAATAQAPGDVQQVETQDSVNIGPELAENTNDGSI